MHYAYPAIIENEITDNISHSYGGGISLSMFIGENFRPVVIKGNRILRNSPNGIWGSSYISNNLIADNTGTYPAMCDGVLINNTIVNNGPTTEGTVVKLYDSSVFSNNLVVNNQFEIEAGSNQANMSNNCFFQNKATGFLSENGNITQDPLFIGRENGNYHLRLDSPCRDMGRDSLIESNWKDFDLEARITGSHVDIGADEINLDTVTVQSPVDFIRQNRWNCISLPLDPVNPDPLQILSGIDVPTSSLQYWDNNTSDWQSFGYLTGWSGPFQRGSAYWFCETHATQNKTISYQGIPISGDFTLNVPVHTQAPFWIQLGTPFADEVSCDRIQFGDPSAKQQYLSWKQAVDSKLISSVAIGFDNVTQHFFTVGPADYHPDRSSFQPWFGYWLLVLKPDPFKIIFPDPQRIE
jgi:hypothetical protein